MRWTILVCFAASSARSRRACPFIIWRASSLSCFFMRLFLAFCSATSGRCMSIIATRTASRVCSSFGLSACCSRRTMSRMAATTQCAASDTSSPSSSSCSAFWHGCATRVDLALAKSTASLSSVSLLLNSCAAGTSFAHKRAPSACCSGCDLRCMRRSSCRKCWYCVKSSCSSFSIVKTSFFFCVLSSSCGLILYDGMSSVRMSHSAFKDSTSCP
mmetsp:Transcript_48545/g.149860  ORF Transcript_48545/g.149860 Transcript_48545/m.149860 type:complete len:215 (-) Transcript_48545:221-865(-)